MPFQVPKLEVLSVPKKAIFGGYIPLHSPYIDQVPIGTSNKSIPEMASEKILNLANLRYPAKNDKFLAGERRESY